MYNKTRTANVMSSNHARRTREDTRLYLPEKNIRRVTPASKNRSVSGFRLVIWLLLSFELSHPVLLQLLINLS